MWFFNDCNKYFKTSSGEIQGVNVLESNEMRQGIKDYTDWPTIPQLYVKGEFIGGCDIVKEMFEKGELKNFLRANLYYLE